MTAIPHWRISEAEGSRARDIAHDWSSIWWDGEGLHISTGEAGERTFIRLHFDRGASFDVMPADRLIVASAHKDDLPPQTVRNLLADQVEPRVLAHEGVFVIHASAVEVDGAAILFTGTSGVGKSTLAASFDRSGIALLCDDAVIVECTDGRATALPLYPSLRLHPDSLAALFPESPLSEAPLYHGMKRRLELPEPIGASQVPLPIAAVFALGAMHSTGELRINPIAPAELCMTLVANSFSLNPMDLRVAGEKLRKAGIVAGHVPAFSLDYPRHYSDLPEVRAAVLELVRNLWKDD